MIDWTPKRRKAFQDAVQKVYTDYTELQMFLDYEVGEPLSDIASDKEGLEKVTYKLLSHFNAQGRLDELYAAFKKENQNHPVINTLVNALERKDLVAQTSNLAQTDWGELFQQFSTDDLLELKRAFKDGFKKAFGIRFNQEASRYPAIAEIFQIRDLLELHDADKKGPLLAVRFVECAIAQFQKSSEGMNRDLTSLEQWRDRIATQFNVSLYKPAQAQDNAAQAYLLIAVEVLAGSEVIVYPELHIVGQEIPMPFGADKIRCSIEQVPESIAEWILLAKETLYARNDEDEIVIEVFLPCRYLDEHIATTWKIKNERGSERDFGSDQRFLVRSLDRVRNKNVRRILKKRWDDLESCVAAQAINGAFHLQDCCPSRKGDLLAALKDYNASGLKLVAPLPTDEKQRIDLLYEIIDAAVPIALWFSDVSDGENSDLCAEFDAILDCHLTNFAELARRWRIRRRESSLSTSIRLLCDRPDRMPNLPDSDRDEDALSFAS